MAIFGPKPWVYPFGKMSIFRLLNFLFLWPRKAIFRSTISQKSFSWPILPKKKELEKWPFLDQNHVLIPLENCEFLEFWNFFFYGLERRFFNLGYRKRHFPSIYCLNQIVGKMAIFGSKPWINSFEKMLIFRVFELLFFIG